MRSRGVVLGSVLVSAAALLGLLAVTIEPARDRSPKASAAPSVPPSATPSPPPSATPHGLPIDKPSAAPAPSAISGPAPAPESSASDDDGAWKTIKPGDKIAGDLFDDPEEPPRARKLRSIGSVTAGVMNASKVLDEHALAAALVKVGGELDAFDRDSQVAPSKRTEQHWAILEKHRASLQPYVRGAVVLRGQGYVLVFDPAPPDAGP